LNGLRPDRALFSESGGFVIALRAGTEEQFEEIVRARGIEPVRIGTTDEDPELEIMIIDENLIQVSIAAMAEVWTTSLARMMGQ